MMPEQAEFVRDSGDYTWRPEYTRRTAPAYVRRSLDSLRPQTYDIRTLGDRIAALEDEVEHLRNIVHKYINQDGTL